MSLFPNFPTEDDVKRRLAAQGLGLPLHSSWGQIELARRACVAADDTGAPVSIRLEGLESARLTYLPTVDPAIVDAIDLIPLEKDVQRKVCQLYEAAGAVVYNLSQARASKQSPGLPDLWVFHEPRELSFWHEVKRPAGSRTDAQERFLALCAATATRYVCGGVEAAKDMLRRLGLEVPHGF